mmetsp:Transcript_18127/g.28119  ORF Transcript_18127/g.28119 Transcript_18127/m.28119 type:complete len:301 (+) Transcript_18127:2712-3614(+)
MLHLGIYAFTASLDADDADLWVIQEGIEQAHRVRPPTDRGNNRIGKATFRFDHLFADFLANDGLKITDHGRIRVRSGDCADAIKRVAHIGHPIAKGIVHGIFERTTARSHRDHFSPQELHSEHVGGLTFDIMRTHIDDAFQAEFGADRGCSHTVLARSGFCDDPGLAHAAGQDDLAQHVVDFMRAGVVQLVALHVNFGTAQFLRQAFGVIKRAGATHIMLPEEIHLSPEAVVGLGLFILFLKAQDQRHQRLGHKAAAKIAKATLFIRAGHEGIEKVVHRAHLPIDWMRCSAKAEAGKAIL